MPDTKCFTYITHLFLAATLRYRVRKLGYEGLNNLLKVTEPVSDKDGIQKELAWLRVRAHECQATVIHSLSPERLGLQTEHVSVHTLLLTSFISAASCVKHVGRQNPSYPYTMMSQKKKRPRGNKT